MAALHVEPSAEEPIDRETIGYARVIVLYIWLGGFNLAAWTLAIALFHDRPAQLAAAALAYGLGLRHAVDADHIAAIDGATRKLMQERRFAADAGAYFALGHSTIVVGLCVVIAIAAPSVRSHLEHWSDVGQFFGAAASIFFLAILAGTNLVLSRSLARTHRELRDGKAVSTLELEHLQAQPGIRGRLFRSLFGLVRRSWHLYPIGLLFGLGFDTATQIGLIALSMSEASHATGAWTIMVYPMLFAAGMALVDSTDSVLMTLAYKRALDKPLKRIRYNLIVTMLSATISVAIGVFELLALIRDHWTFDDEFWRGIDFLDAHFTALGCAIVAMFMTIWLASMWLARWSGEPASGAKDEKLHRNSCCPN